jgi:hypothetical protein
MMVSEYVTRFTQLSHNAPNDVDTDEKKQECFLKGLDDGLVYALEARDFDNIHTMLNKDLVLKNRREMLPHKCKQERQTQQSINTRPHISSSPGRPIFHPITQSFQPMPQPIGHRFVTPQRQLIPHPNLF